jgi:TPR repeat protein
MYDGPRQTAEAKVRPGLRGTIGLALLLTLGGAPAAADTSTALAAYERGEFASAFEEFHLLADDGNSEAMLWTGYLYQEGQGTAQNFGEAMRYYRMAADSGQAQAFYYIGIIYQDGLGVDPDPIEAVRWYRQAAERNDVYGQYALADAYEYGKGAPRDRRAARRWYQAAADQGHEEARAKLQVLADPQVE